MMEIHTEEDERLADGVTVGDTKYVAGTMIVSKSGKVKISATVTIDGVKYTVKNSFVTSAKVDDVDHNAENGNIEGLFEVAQPATTK